MTESVNEKGHEPEVEGDGEGDGSKGPDGTFDADPLETNVAAADPQSEYAAFAEWVSEKMTE